MADDIQLQVNYYARNGYGQHIKSLCSLHLQKRQKDPVLFFWHAFGSIVEESHVQALHELRPLIDHREVEFAAIAALLHVHQLCSMIEIDEVRNLELRLEAAEKRGSERSLFLAATLYCHLGGCSNVTKSKDLVAKIVRVQPHYAPAQCLKGWLNLLFYKNGMKRVVNDDEDGTILDSESLELSLGIFDEVLSKGNCLEALLGRAYYYELKGDIAEARNELNQVIVSNPSFIPALCEKARVGFLLQDWLLVQEAAQLILQKDTDNIEALRMTIHAMLCNENDTPSVLHLLEKLVNSIEQTETRNANLCLEVARPLARIAGRGRSKVLPKTLALVERAQKLYPDQARFAIEIAEEQFLLADYKAALSSYRLASQLDELNMEAMYGAVQCLLILGELESTEQQLEFLVEICYSMGESASICYLMAQLAWEKSKDFNTCRELLVKTLNYQTKGLIKKRDHDFYVNLNPDRLLGVAHLFLVISRYECKGLHVNKSFCLQRAVETLEIVLSVIPGLLDGQLMLAEALIKLENLDPAQCTLQTALTLDPTCATAQILLTQIYVQRGKHELAKQSLERALSDNFVVRDTLKYNGLHAQILVQAEADEEALKASSLDDGESEERAGCSTPLEPIMNKKVLESAMCLPGMKGVSINSDRSYYSSPESKRLQGASTDEDRVLVYLLQAEVHMRLGHVPEATKIINDAMLQFVGTPEEMKVMIANCDLALARGDVNAALALLQQVPCESSYYVKAQTTIADIYMKHWHDQVRYLKCYEELAGMFPNAKTYMMLGNAFMKIDELEKAVKAYETAMRESPDDAAVALQVGKALVTTHNYAKAIEHYKSAVQNIQGKPMTFVLSYELADLYFKLKNYEQVEIVLNDLLAKAEGDLENKELKGTATLLPCLKGSLLLSKVQHLLGKCGTSTEVGRRSNTASRYLPTYKVMFSAKNIQCKLLSTLHGQHQDAIKEQRNVAADIYFHFAQECEAQKDLDKTVTLLNEALTCNPAHSPAILALAKLHLSRGEVSECEQKCADILRLDPFNSEAGDILVHLMLYRELYESAITHFKQNLERDPNHYASLCQLIRLLRSSGQMDDIQPYIVKAEKGSSAFRTNAGLYYCKGLIARYANNRFEALQMLNQARADAQWGTQALYLLIEVYLNIDNELVWEESNSDGTTVGNEEGIKAAWKLLGESRLLDNQAVKQLVLECYATMATRQKADIEFALGRLTEAFAKGEQKVPVLLAIAIAWTLLKQTAKAKLQLRQIERSVYRWEDGEDFERAWLMLASILIQSGKHDAAEDLCRKCLKYNKDCARAWEYLGSIMETNHSFAEAVGYLENSWKCHKEASPSVGYRLAFTYLKEKRYVEAISVCHKVLKVCHNYPRIKKDILDKARQCVRA